jgi:UDP-glucose 4-epimerase
MKLVVLGKSGFIGKAIFEHYHGSKEHEVRGLNSSQLNLTSPNAANELAKLLDNNTTLIVSARAGKNSDPLQTLEQDIAMTNNIARAVAITPVKKCVYFSSIAVYGEAVENVSITEETETSPTSLYGISRMAGEFAIKSATEKSGIPLTIFRPCMIYGPGDRVFSYGPDLFLKCALEDTSVKIFGEGTEIRDYLYIKDLVKVTAYFIQNNLPGTYLLGTGQSRSFLDIVECIKEITHRNVKTEEVRQTQLKINQKLNIQKLTQAFPGVSFTPFNLGVRDTLEHTNK